MKSKIGPRTIGDGEKCLVVAELGLNHNGSIERALDMVRTARRAGCEAVKVQAFTASEFTDETETYTYQQIGVDGKLQTVTERQRDLFQRCEFRLEHFQAIRDECRKLGLLFIATATDARWVETMRVLGADALKVGSDDLTHIPLLRTMAKTGLPVILSTGMATESDIATALHELQPAAILHCVSLYPTPAEKANLGRMDALRRFGVPVGFSDHVDGVTVAAMAIFRGAAVLEKHFTLDRGLPGPDHRFSANPAHLEALCSTAGATKAIFGDREIDTGTDADMAMLARRSIVAAVDIEPGQVIGPEMLAYKRPGTGLSPALVDLVVGSHALVMIKAGRQLEPLHLGWQVSDQVDLRHAN